MSTSHRCTSKLNLRCLWCKQQGFVEEEETVEIELPPPLKSGTVVDVPLQERGIRNLVLRVYVRIGREW